MLFIPGRTLRRIVPPRASRCVFPAFARSLLIGSSTSSFLASSESTLSSAVGLFRCISADTAFYSKGLSETARGRSCSHPVFGEARSPSSMLSFPKPEVNDRRGKMTDARLGKIERQYPVYSGQTSLHKASKMARKERDRNKAGKRGRKNDRTGHWRTRIWQNVLPAARNLGASLLVEKLFVFRRILWGNIASSDITGLGVIPIVISSALASVKKQSCGLDCDPRSAPSVRKPESRGPEHSVQDRSLSVASCLKYSCAGLKLLQLFCTHFSTSVGSSRCLEEEI